MVALEVTYHAVPEGTAIALPGGSMARIVADVRAEWFDVLMFTIKPRVVPLAWPTTAREWTNLADAMYGALLFHAAQEWGLIAGFDIIDQATAAAILAECVRRGHFPPLAQSVPPASWERECARALAELDRMGGAS